MATQTRTQEIIVFVKLKTPKQIEGCLVRPT